MHPPDLHRLKRSDQYDKKSNDPSVKHWAAKRKAALAMDISKRKTTVAEVARLYDRTVLKVWDWIKEGQRSM